MPENRTENVRRIALRLAWIVCALVVLLLSTWLYREWRDLNHSLSSRGKLKNIALAMHVYAAEHGLFPPQALCSPDGVPLLSWRVVLLPYVSEDVLYREFRLDEPWDSAHNQLLLAKIPAIYQFDETLRNDQYNTLYQAFVGGGAAFDGRSGVPLTDFSDGSARTILVIEASHPVPWTKPEDLSYAPDLPLPMLGGVVRREFNFAAADGTTVTFPKHETEQFIRRWITRRGGEPWDEKEKKYLP